MLTSGPFGCLWEPVDLNDERRHMINRTRFVPILSFILIFGLTGWTQTIPTSPSSSRAWIATWGASPSDASSIGVSGQTIREMVRVSLGGEWVRIRLSNLFGAKQLVVGTTHLALHAAGPAIVAGSDRIVTFSGRRSVVLPPRALVVSDPISLRVSPLQELAVSLYLPGDTGPLTIHTLGMQTAYLSIPGDFTAALSLPVASTSLSRYLLSQVEVLAPGSAQALVALGDSLTDGNGSTIDANHRWPDLLANRLSKAPGRQLTAVVNDGINGNRLLHDNFGPSALERFDRDVLAVPGASTVIVLLGLNDFGLPGFLGTPSEIVSAADVIAAYRQLIVRAHDSGLVIYASTLLPYEGNIYPGYYTPEGEMKRQTVNAWIRSSHEFDAVIDFDQVVRDPGHPTRLLPAFDSGDHLHPNDAGYAAMANAVDLELLNPIREMH